MKTQKTTNPVREITFMGIMIALNVIAVRFLSIETPFMRVGFGFIAFFISGMYLGPLRSGIVAALADLVGMALFAKAQYFPGFTLSSFIAGTIAGAMLEGKKSKDLRWVIGYGILSTLIADTILVTIWLVMINHQGDLAFFIPRLLPRLPYQGVITVLKIILIPIFYRTVFVRLRVPGVERPGIREAA
ncbi:Substrate-specific component FolT of folate ECF transporter [Clostridiaceae bacterium JG1575]|nr:Substrate-specific component FolT of folate ECF transporter [Clostridiaceae bacterium JG1575]